MKKISRPTSDDAIDITLQGGIRFHGGSVAEDHGEVNAADFEMDRLDELLDGGKHHQDHPRNWGRLHPAAHKFPFQSMLLHDKDQGFQRPAGGRRVRWTMEEEAS